MAYPILAPNSTWYKSSTARSTITQINIVNSYTPTGNENESWNADVGNTGSIKCYRTGTVITMAGNGSGKIAMNADSSFVFSDSTTESFFNNVTAINGLETLDATNATTMQVMFCGCVKLQSIDLSTWNVQNVTTMNYMFGGHSNYGGNMSLISIGDTSNWNTASLTNTRCMFQNCDKLTALNVSNWNVSKVTTMEYMFSNCSSLMILDVSKWDTGTVENMRSLFYGCTSLTALDVSNWDVSKVTTMRSMFSQNSYGTPTSLTSLDVSKWDTSSCTDMGWTFYGCSKLTTLDVSNWDVSKVTSFHHMFAWCWSLVPCGVENWDTSSAQYMNAMFHSNANTYLDLSGWDVSKVKSFAQMFERNTLLIEIKGLEKWDTSSGQTFGEMFHGCQSLKELNLSSFDTRNANDSFYDEIRGDTSEHGMLYMFGVGDESEDYGWMMRLEKITLGENFSFNGDGTAAPAVLPTQVETYISGADGNWYDSNGTAYAASSIPNGDGIYYAVKAFALGNISKVEYFGRVLVDLTEDSVTPETLGKGVTAHDKTGAPIVGTMESESGFTPPDSEYLDPNEVYRTTRPRDWLPMPTPGDDEIYLLGQLTEGIDNKFSIRLNYSGTCTVQIGTVVDGAFVAKRTLSVTSGTAFTYVVPWDEYGDTTADGYRQYMVKCKGKITYTLINGDAGISSVVDCVIGIPNLWFYAGHASDQTLACHTLRYLRFVGNGYPFCTTSIIGYCRSCLCVSCEKQITSNPYPSYAFMNASQLIAVSPQILFTNSEATALFWGAGIRRIPMENLRPTSLANCFREACNVFVDGSTFGNVTYYGLAFYMNRSLKEAVNLDITKANNFELAFGYCTALEKITFAGTTAVGGYTIDLSACKLSHTALVTMIASLPTATNAATITITNNPGASELTAAEIAVATAKNWTITI